MIGKNRKITVIKTYRIRINWLRREYIFYCTISEMNNSASLTSANTIFIWDDE